MKRRTLNKLTLAVSAILLVGSQATMVHAADGDYSGIAAPQKYTPSTGSYPPPPPGGWDGVVNSIDKQIENDKKELESSRGGASMAAEGQTFDRGASFPEFQDPPEWAERDISNRPEWGDRGMPEPPSWAERDMPEPPEWGSSDFPAPPEWGGGSMPEPPEWGDRSIPEPPEWAERDIPEPPKWDDRGIPEPPKWEDRGMPPAPEWANRNIPDPPDWGRSMPAYAPPRYDRGRGSSFSTPSFGSGSGPSFGSGRGPSFSGPWDSGRGGRDYNRPWGGSGPSFKGPWESGRGGSSMPWD